MMNSDLIRQLDGNSASFCMDIKPHNVHHGLDGGGGIEFPAQSLVNHEEGCNTSTSVYTSISHQSMLYGKKLSAPCSEADFQSMQNSRKRWNDAYDNFPNKGVHDLVHNTSCNQWKKKSKKDKTPVWSEGRCPNQEKDVPIVKPEDFAFQMPVRRSQKLGDRVTALQKLVSPYGKTDTASVLHEASICIKLLQEQIETLTTVYMGSKHIQPKNTGEDLTELQSRGLCLVPVSLIKHFSKDIRVDNAITRTTIIPRYTFN